MKTKKNIKNNRNYKHPEYSLISLIKYGIALFLSLLDRDLISSIAREGLVVRVLGSRLRNRCWECDDEEDKLFAKFRDKLSRRSDNGIVSVTARACS